MNKELIPQDDKPKTSTELISLVTETKQRQFLDNYEKCNRRITKTADAIGVNESTVHYWQNHSDVFAQAFQALKKELDYTRIEDYLDNIKQIAFDPKVPPQSRLLGSFFELKALDPKYKDRQDIPQVATQIVIHTNIPEPEYKTIEGEYTETKDE